MVGLGSKDSVTSLSCTENKSSDKLNEFTFDVNDSSIYRSTRSPYDRDRVNDRGKPFKWTFS